MRRIAVSLAYGLAFRNLACTGALDRVVESGIEPFVYLPPLAAADAATLHSELPAATSLRSLAPARPATKLKLLKFLKQHFYRRRTALDSFEVRRNYRRQEQPAFHVLASLVEAASSRLVDEAQVDRWLTGIELPGERAYLDHMTRDRVEALVVTKPGYLPDELPLIKAARRLGLPVLSADTTWDNIVSKRPAYLPLDAVTVWNVEMARQVAEHYLWGSAARVTGGPQFDTFFRSPAASREDVLQRFQVDHPRPLIVFALNNPVLTPGNVEYVQMIAAVAADGRVAGDPLIVVRLHPWDPGRGYETLDRLANVRVERPFGAPATGTAFECIPTRHRVDWHGALFRHMDVLINIASTASLDGIAADVPVVNLAFDAVPTHPATSVARYTRYSHFKPILDTKAVRSADSLPDMVRLVNAALADRSADEAFRRSARGRFLTFEDDQSARRVADAIVTMP